MELVLDYPAYLSVYFTDCTEIQPAHGGGGGGAGGSLGHVQPNSTSRYKMRHD